jgi:hypothetical protein
VPGQADAPTGPVRLPPERGTMRIERESVAALFLVHMFPIGHLPVAADRPAAQLPAPDEDVDYAAGQRFEPGDHPESSLVDAGDALTNILAGLRRSPGPAPSAVPEALRAGHDPLGGVELRDWNRRFLGGVRGSVPEYAWPPGQLHPEGGREAGKPILLTEGELLDRVGGDGGRVFAPAGTSFASRSLPPELLLGEYHEYRVLRPLPVWRTVSAPWFGQPGDGVRYRATHPAGELVTLGYLAEITLEGEK